MEGTNVNLFFGTGDNYKDITIDSASSGARVYTGNNKDTSLFIIIDASGPAPSYTINLTKVYDETIVYDPSASALKSIVILCIGIGVTAFIGFLAAIFFFCGNNSCAMCAKLWEPYKQS